MIKSLIFFVVFVCASGISNASFADDKKVPASFISADLGSGIYMLKGVNGFTGGNIGILNGSDGVIMIDDSMPPHINALLEVLSAEGINKVDFLINTHVHGDHVGNNTHFGKKNVHIVAHENLRERLKTGHGVEAADAKALPVLTFEENMSFHLNGQTTTVQHLPHAHTDGDAIVIFKEANIIHAGDLLFHSMFPYIDYERGGSVNGYIAAQEKIIALSDSETKIIPGHGELATKKDLEKDLAMLKDAKSIVAALVAKNKTEDEVVELNPLAKFHEKWNWGFITTERMTRQLYKGLSSKGSTDHSGEGHYH